MSDIESVEVLDRYTVKITLKKPINLLVKLADPGDDVFIFAHESYEAEGGLETNVIGTGPFMLVEFEPGQGFRMEKNPNYFGVDEQGRPLPYMDAIVGIYIPDPGAQMAAMRTKQIDAMEFTAIRDVDALLATNPDVFIIREPPQTPWVGYILKFRLNEPPYDNVDVRRALSMAIDRQTMIDFAFDGDGEVFGPLPWPLAGIKEWRPP